MSSGQLDVMKQCDEMCTEKTQKLSLCVPNKKFLNFFFKTGDLTIIQQVFWDG